VNLAVKAVIVASSFATATASIYALLYSHFVPSPLGLRLAVFAAILCSVGGVALAFQPSPFSDRSSKPEKLWVRVPAFGLLCFGLGYSAFAAGFPAWYTTAFGFPSERIVTVEKWRQRSRFSCEGPDLIEVPLPNTICLSQKSAPFVRPGAKLVVRGRATALGIKVETVLF
jgi:hypothetical protein